MAYPDLREGEELAGFRIGARLHVGGMSVLWEATHPDHAMPLVVRVPRLAEGEDPAAIVSFEMEQMILPRLSGPHVPRFVAAGGFDRQPYLAMERIRGPGAFARLEPMPMPVAEVARIGAKVADALEALHRQHVVHLDLKPSHVLLRPTGEAVLVDFGLSHHAQLPDLMQEEFRLPYGTAPYMAPEQVTGLRGDRRSDLFALGAMLYLLLTGQRPHGDPQRLSGLRHRLWRDPVPPRALRTDCPDWLQEIILRCLEVEPAQRHPTAAQLAFDLRHPEQVALTARALRRRQDGWSTALRRRLQARNRRFAATPEGAAGAPAAAPIVVAAVDLGDADPAMQAAFRTTLKHILATLPGARLACLHVLHPGHAANVDGGGGNRHVQRLVELQHWAAPLGLPAGRLTCHVLEAADAATAILDHACSNGVDHIVMGERANSLRRRMLGSVSAQVASDATCSVTVVRVGGALATQEE